MITWRVSWSQDIVYIEVIKDGVVMEMQSIKDVPADIYNTHIVAELKQQAKGMGAEFEEVEMKKTNERGRPKKNEGTKIVALRLPESLVADLTKKAHETGIPLATYCKMVLMKDMHRKLL